MNSILNKGKNSLILNLVICFEGRHGVLELQLCSGLNGDGGRHWLLLNQIRWFLSLASGWVKQCLQDGLVWAY